MITPHLLLSFAIVVAVASRTGLATVPSGGYASYLGGRANDYGTENAFGIDVDADGSAYVGGTTQSAPFPAERRYGTADQGGFVVKVSPDGSRLIYSTYFDDVEVIAVKLTASKELYALGHIWREPQPFINLGAHAGGYTDAVLLKLDAQGALLWGRYIGGSDLEVPRALAVDPEGNAYLAGFTTSTNFPTTAGAAQLANAGGFDGFVVKVSPTGKVIYATYIGGQSSENLLGLAVDSQRRATVVGYGFSESFGSTPVSRILGPGGGTDGFICRLNAQGSAVEWATKIGGSNRDSALAIALDSDGTIVLLGSTESPDFPVNNTALQTNLLAPADLYLARVSADGQQLLAATYFGSTDGEDLGDPFYFEFILNGVNEQRSLFPEGVGLAIGPGGNIHIGARINSGNFPAAAEFPAGFAGSRDAYLARISASLETLLDFQFFGSASDDEARAIAVDPSGNSYLAGTSYAPSLPPFLITSPAAFQPAFGGSAMDALVIKVPAAPAPLTNDAFAGRTRLEGTRTSASVRIDVATSEPGEPAHGAGAAKSVWFTWRAPISGRVVATTAGSSFEPFLEVYTGSSLQTLSLLGSTEAARVAIVVNAGVDYHFALVGTQAASGLARLSVALSQPANDDLSAATLLTGFPVLAEGSNINSTAEAGEPPHDDHIPARSVWWRWVAPATQSTMISTEGSTFDTVLAIYAGETLETLTRVASHDNISSEVRTSEAVFLAEAGKGYFIAVDGPPDEFGAIRLRILSNEPPPNDSFATRSNLTGLFVQTVASNLRATIEPGEPRLSFTNAFNEVDASFSGATIWWTWTAPRDGRLRLDTFGSDFDTRLGIYTGTALSNLTRIAAHDDVNRQIDQRTSVVEMDVFAGTEYFIQVDGSTGRPSGIARLNLKLAFPPRILGFTAQSNGGWTLRAEGVPATNYTIEISTDLRNWVPLTVPAVESNGIWTFTLPTLSSPHAFLRLATIE